MATYQVLTKVSGVKTITSDNYFILPITDSGNSNGQQAEVFFFNGTPEAATEVARFLISSVEGVIKTA